MLKDLLLDLMGQLSRDHLQIIQGLIAVTGIAGAYVVLSLAPLLLLVVPRSLVLFFQDKRKMLCTTCGHQGPSKKKLRGSVIIEALCWLFALVPGLIYGAWRWVSRCHTCPLCSATNMIPASSPEALTILREREAKAIGYR
ncbi:MAG: hypothetical protein AB7F86_09610 [Bdellovibrionales bacterium]